MGEILDHLPGHNCGACGHARCDELAEALAAHRASPSACVILRQERYREDRVWLEETLAATKQASVDESRPSGLIDGYEADFVLHPLGTEPSCREMLLPLTPPSCGAGNVIRYRPLGCPITHFARVLQWREGLLTVHIVGPCHRLGAADFPFADIGLCMVIGFEGVVAGTPPDVGATVRFIPDGCMMQKVHTAVVVSCEGRAVRLEGVDLKVWAPPVRAKGA